MARTTAPSWWQRTMARWFGRPVPAPVRPTGERPVWTGELATHPERALTWGVVSDPGCVRDANEDAAIVVHDVDGSATGGVLAVVCDGMGGHAAGEVASAMAIEALREGWRAHHDAAVALADALRLAHTRIAAEASRGDARRGMGTTCVAVIVRHGFAWCAYVGDSRCYLVRGETLLLMTEDHSAVMTKVKRGELTPAEARVHPDRNVIHQALGGGRAPRPGHWPQPFRLFPDDRLLLCSDGLCDVVDDESMRRLASTGDPERACAALVDAARAAGAPDNVTALLLVMPPSVAAHADRVRSADGATRITVSGDAA